MSNCKYYCKRLKKQVAGLKIFLFIGIFFISCTAPYGYFETKDRTNCFYIKKNLEIQQQCIERKKQIITMISVIAVDDTGFSIAGKKQPDHVLFKDTGPIKFPYSLHSVIDKNKSYQIFLETEIPDYSFALKLNKDSFVSSDSVNFIYYHPK